MSVVDALSQETRYEYDSRNRLVATINADGTESQSRYDFDNNLIGNIDGNGNRTTSLYDARNRLIRSIDALGNVTQYTYDVVNQLIAVTDSEGNQTRYEYDELGRQITIIDALGNETRTEYDKVGNVMAEIDALGNRIEYEYDAQNRVISVTDPNNGETITAYDKVGNVVAIIDPVGNRTSYTYDARNRLLTETNQLGATRSYKYDAVGNQIEVTDRNNRVRSFTYDALNRPKEEIWLDEEGNPIRTITSTYDSGSQLTKISDSDSTYTLTYDLRGRLIAMDNAGTPGVPNVVLNYSYDSNGNLLEMTDSLGGITTYTYDELNRVSKIAQNGSGVSEKRVDFSYNTLGQYEAINRYSDLDGTNLVIGTTYVYDELNRLSSLTHSNGLSKNVAFYNFAYDAASRITQITDIDGITNYNYDERNQLIGADRSDENNPDESYSYDANGNRISSHLHSNYTTGDNNRLESDGVYNYEYDGEGNLIRETEIATGNVREYEWDWRNRLVSVVDSGEVTQSVSYTYDVFNRRIAKTVNGVVTYFVQDSLDNLSNVVLEFVDEDGVAGAAEPVLAQRYLHGPGVDQVLVQEDENGTSLWHLGDQLGTIRDLANNSGEVVNHYTYNSFGNLIAQTDDEVENRYLYTGREFDSETGLHYYRARYYNAATGKFISLDPIGFNAGDSNLYRYVGNSPIGFIDPFGEMRTFDPSHPDCIALARKINNIRNDIQKRLTEINQNPLNLPETCPGGKPRESVQGHRDIVRDLEKTLQKRIQQYMNMCGGPPPGVPAVVPAPAPAPQGQPNNNLVSDLTDYFQELLDGASKGTLTPQQWAILILLLATTPIGTPAPGPI